jgi:site-specific DNA-methyltransferase (cytosine-N4-specific)
LRKFAETKRGIVYAGDSLRLFERHIEPGTVDLIVTSPPFGLVRKKQYGNVDAHEYLEWFKPFGKISNKS